MAPTFSSYCEFVRIFVLPLREAHPGWRRLDGRPSGGNRSIAAFLIYGSQMFCVHEDAWIESLIEPCNVLRQRPVESPLVVVPTRGGVRKKLAPRPGYGSGKGFYVYQYP